MDKTRVRLEIPFDKPEDLALIQDAAGKDDLQAATWLRRLGLRAARRVMRPKRRVLGSK